MLYLIIFFELSKRRPLIIIIIAEFKVGCTYICTTAHYTHYKICYSNTIFDMLTWGYNDYNNIYNYNNYYNYYNSAKKKEKKLNQINQTTQK